MIVVIKRRDTTRNERDRLNRQAQVVRAHNKGLLGSSWYSEDKTGEKTGTKGSPYISPLKIQRKT